jgi:hypothetical protein
VTTPFRCYFAAVHAPDWLALPAGDWDRVVECGIAGIDVRMSWPKVGPTGPERTLAKRVHEAGLDLRIHGWVGKSDAEGFSIATERDGIEQGGWLGRCGAELDASMVGPNSEYQVWRWRGGKANPNALGFYRGVHVGSLKAYPLGRLQDVGFRDPREHYDPRADLDKNGVPDALIPRDVAELFDLKGVMAYQSNEATLKRGLTRAREIAGPGVPMSWWSGVGRPSPTQGVVGDYHVTLKGCRERWSGISEWTGYVGFTERGQKQPTIEMLTKGHARHGPLVQLVREINGKVV